jgi:hypothetical protein
MPFAAENSLTFGSLFIHYRGTAGWRQGQATSMNCASCPGRTRWCGPGQALQEAYLITNRLVLTAWHVIRPLSGKDRPSQIKVRAEGRIDEGQPASSAEELAQVLWPQELPDDDHDFALLQLCEPLPLDPVQWLSLDGLQGHGRIDFRAIGS